MTRRTTSALRGHPDTGKRTSRTWQTREALHRYIGQRNQRESWAREGSEEGARFDVKTDRDGRWRWHLRDSDGTELAHSTGSYDDKASAEQALERTRYLSHELS